MSCTPPLWTWRSWEVATPDAQYIQIGTITTRITAAQKWSVQLWSFLDGIIPSKRNWGVNQLGNRKCTSRAIKGRCLHKLQEHTQLLYGIPLEGIHKYVRRLSWTLWVSLVRSSIWPFCSA
jgi:hypothetical protein